MVSENTPTIVTERLILRKFTHEDATDLLEFLRDEEVNTFLPWYPVKTREEAEAFLNTQFLSHYEKPSAYRYAVCRKKDNRPIGYLCLSGDESHDFGYGLKKEFWGKGVITEAAMVVVERIRGAGYAYITATHDINNPRSGEVMKRLGMTYRYTYVEQRQPKNFPVTFRMYQFNFDGKDGRTYTEYWNKHVNHFVEEKV